VVGEQVLPVLVDGVDVQSHFRTEA
jgi:hypothetical protein